MKAPLTVKIVEALGWAYVALGGVFLFHFASGSCGCWGIVNPVQAGLWGLVFAVGLPLSMVWALRQGLRGWFLWPHAIFVGFFALRLRSFALVALLVVPAVLLFLPRATQWFMEMSEGRKKRWWQVTARLPIAILMSAQFLSMVGGSFPPSSVWSYCHAVEGAENLRLALAENEQLRKAGRPWVDPSLHEDTGGFLYALERAHIHRDMDRTALDVITAESVVPWCIAVNPPDDGSFPIVCTANLNPADLFRPEGESSPVALKCPGGKHLVVVHGKGPPHEECNGFCKRAAIVVARNGELIHVRAGSLLPRMFTSEKSPEVDKVRYLTPTGIIDIAVRR